MQTTKTVSLTSLGCAKNLVNSEQMLYLLTEAGYTPVSDPGAADIAVVNTCGFIDSAKTEAIDTILEIAELKKSGRLKALIVCGCLAERYKDEIISEMPEIDAVLGVGSFSDIAKAVDAALGGRKLSLFGDKNAAIDETRRVVSTSAGYAYLKIAEGCDNRCAYCVIPEIRGSYRSRPMENIIDEAKRLIDGGADGSGASASGKVSELIIVAQDITRYGTDLYGERRLAALLAELIKLPVTWIRLHYLYPDEIDGELIELIANEEKILKYLDIPIQHIDDKVLRRMNRRGSGGEIRDLIKKLREKIPGLVLRTSLIVGHPGEGEAEFNTLCDFLREAKIERAGVFCYSPEEGTPAYAMTDRCDPDTAQKRAEIIMNIQSGVIDGFAEAQIGKTLPVLIEGYDELTGQLWGRSYAESPDIDGRILINNKKAPIGEIFSALITGVINGEMTGEIK